MKSTTEIMGVWLIQGQMYIIGVTPDQTMVYTEFYHDLRLQILKAKPSYSNMTNYFKLNNYYKFYSKMVIDMSAIIQTYHWLY